MKTIEEKIAVMQAFAEGKEIECAELGLINKSWMLTINPVWNWSKYDYRVKTEHEYIPFTFEDAKQLIGKIVKSKESNWVEMIIWCSDTSTSVADYEDLLSDNTFLDGSPCGKLKQ